MTMDLVLGAALACLAVMGAVTVVNTVGFHPLRTRKPAPPELLSVLIPARNEERNIGHLLELLGAQDFPAFEVIVLDDDSEDQTGAVVRARMDADPRVSLVKGKPLPQGWVGKAYACHQLSELARGELLLFMDADTRPSARALSAGLSELEHTRADLLTAIPRQETVSFWERVLLPVLHFVTLSFLPMPLVPVTRSPKLAMANGQFMLFRRDAYRAIGGHASVRSALVEDVWLARRIKATGRKLVIRYGGEEVGCRMYRSLPEIWEGFSKNIFPGLDYSPVMLGVVGAVTVLTSILPFVLLAGSVLTGEVGQVPLLLAAGVLGIRIVQALRLEMELWPVLLHPVAMVIFLAIAVNSWRWTLAGGGSRWKGRAYRFKNPPVAT